MSTMKKWCNHCVKMVIAERPFDGSLCCSECGKVFELYNFSNDPTFEKDSGGQSSLSGNFVRTVQSDYSASRERTLDRAFDDMRYLCLSLGMDQADGVVKAALAFYRMALEKNFTRGRRSEHVQAACLYIACREDKLPYLLIDFSNMLQINVYVLGAVFLQLCKVLWLEEHHILQKPTDPSLFIHKYTTSLSGGRNNDISRTALRIIASMRRDWMQTGRKPSGLWGAAVYVSALAHGVKCTKNDVLRLVHICEATLTKRLVEFENTKSGSLTVEELNEKARAEEKMPVKHPNIVDPTESRELLCEHKGTGVAHYAIGLCQTCYTEFVDFSGGLEGGSDPPAFQRAERERQALAAAEEANESAAIEKELDGPPADKFEKMQSDPGKAAECSTFEDDHPDDGSDNLSDIDDAEVDGYLHNEQEKRFKKIIWEQMNREYMEEQAAKEKEAAAARAAFNNGSEDTLDARELAAATAAALAKSKKEKQQKRAAEAKNAKPPQTAAEATRQILEKKRLTSKVNYDVLEKLFDEPAAKPVDANKKRATAESKDDDVKEKKGGKKQKKEEKKHAEKDEEEEEVEEEEPVVEADVEMGVLDDYNLEDTEDGYGYDEEW